MEIVKYSEYNKINENFFIPSVKFEIFLTNVESAGEKHVKAIETFFKTYKQYINIENKATHTFKLNDISGDILNNNRVIAYVKCFHTYEVDKIRENIVNYCITNFYSELPQQLTIFGASITPSSVINKEELKDIFDKQITKDMTVKIVSVLSKYAYSGVQDDFYLWKKGE